MNAMVVIFGGLVVFFVLFWVALGVWHPKTARSIVGRSLRDDEAEADIEAHDIEQMLDAQAELRARSGRPDLGDELAEGARRRPPA